MISATEHEAENDLRICETNPFPSLQKQKHQQHPERAYAADVLLCPCAKSFKLNSFSAKEFGTKLVLLLLTLLSNTEFEVKSFLFFSV